MVGHFSLFTYSGNRVEYKWELVLCDEEQGHVRACNWCGEVVQ